MSIGLKWLPKLYSYRVAIIYANYICMHLNLDQICAPKLLWQL